MKKDSGCLSISPTFAFHMAHCRRWKVSLRIPGLLFSPILTVPCTDPLGAVPHELCPPHSPQVGGRMVGEAVHLSHCTAQQPDTLLSCMQFLFGGSRHLSNADRAMQPHCAVMCSALGQGTQPFLPQQIEKVRMAQLPFAQWGEPISLAAQGFVPTYCMNSCFLWAVLQTGDAPEETSRNVF